MFKFGEKSLSKLSTVHPDLQKVMLYAITRSDIDFGISYGLRTVEEQFELYKKGRSLINGKWVVDKTKGGIVTQKDGINNKSKHNTGEAVDIFMVFPNNNGESYNRFALCYVAGIVRSASEELYAKGVIKNKVTWGANWDSDGDFLFDHTFVDMPHFEI